MSAVAEREAATFEELEAALERKRERLRASSAKLLDLVSEEQVALDDFLRATPDKNPWTVGTKRTLAEGILPHWNKLAESFEAREALRGEGRSSEPARAGSLP